jgi:hypothetical protein
LHAEAVLEAQIEIGELGAGGDADVAPFSVNRDAKVLAYRHVDHGTGRAAVMTTVEA